MAAYGELEVRLHPFVTSALDGGVWSGLYPGTHWVGPRVDLHPLFLSETKPRFLGCPASRLVTMPTETSRLQLTGVGEKKTHKKTSQVRK